MTRVILAGAMLWGAISPFFGFSSGVRAIEKAAVEAGAPRNWDFSEMGLLPVQGGGRIKPFESFAREAVLFVTGKRSYEGWGATDLVLSWITAPQHWNRIEFIRVEREDVRKQLLLESGRKLFSPHELYRNSVLIQYAEQQGGRKNVAPVPGEPRQNPRDAELSGVLDRLGLYRSLVTGDAPRLVPVEGRTDWESVLEARELWKKGDPGPLRRAYADLIRAYYEKDEAAFVSAVRTAMKETGSRIDGFDGLMWKLKAEAFYQRFRPFQLAFGFYVIAAIFWTLSLGAGEKKKRGWTLAALGLTGAGFLLHVLGFVLRVYVSGRPPVSNMYESIVWVSFGVVVFAGVIYFLQKQRQGVLFAVATFLAALALMAADSSPLVMDPGLHPLVPVLRSNFWLMVHVLTITLGYAAFALALGIADVTLYQYLREALGKKVGAAKISGLNQLAYRAMQFGVVLLAAGTILGGVWADYSWGRFWGWDPKETWALIALLCYLAVLHGRFTGWVGQFGFAAWTVICFLSVVMAWYGVNFVLGVGLHSYGFSAGGVEWVGVACLAQLAYVVAIAAMRRRRQRKRA